MSDFVYTPKHFSMPASIVVITYKCTKHQFIHLLTVTLKSDIARITLTVCQCPAE